jgi:RNA polymerase primary sigma factor
MRGADNEPFEATVPDPHSTSDFDRVDAEIDIQDFLEKLTPTERAIINLRFGLDGKGPRTHQEVINEGEFKVTRERIRQIEKAALQKMKKITSEK